MMRLIATFASVILLWAAPVSASEYVERLATAMQLDQVVEIFREEGLTQGRELDEMLLSGSGGTFFHAQVDDTFDPIWMRSKITDALGARMNDKQLEQAAIFFESDLGKTIVALENSARRAFSDETVEEMAQSSYEDMDRQSEFFRLIEEYIEINDLIERNVQGSFSSDYRFFRGIMDGQGIVGDDGEMLAELLAQKDETETVTRNWLYSFLLLAYRPLNEAQMRENIAFSRTDAGRALNDALFIGLDEMFNETSYQLGMAVGRVVGASEL